MKVQLLRDERKKKGFTQAYMAEQLGYKDKSSYCLIENGKINPTVDTASKIIKVLGLSSKMAHQIFLS